jgi:Mn-dependent DtxR family transcriptional regulator
MAIILDDYKRNITTAANRMIDKGYLITNSSGMYALTKEGHARLDEMVGERALMHIKMSDKQILKNTEE